MKLVVSVTTESKNSKLTNTIMGYNVNKLCTINMQMEKEKTQL